jgi:asparagine synthase (glutamine-hydrolysing)
MCGILGWIGAQSNTPEAFEACGRGIAALRNRGPDGARIQQGSDWVLGQTRLAILDLTERASQPMRDERGSWIVFNGEIYNFKELRRELEGKGARFRTTGDTEVLLAALTHWGLGALTRLRGMFAFGWIDPDRKELILARDRYGVKPLVWERTTDGVRFASDLFALDAMAGGARARAIDPQQVQRYLMLGYVPAPHTIWKGPRKLLPGHFLRIKWGATGATNIEERSYWRLSDIPTAAAEMPSGGFERFTDELREAVRSRLVSDVPIGLLLSGGVDSSLVAAVCAELPGPKLPSFTMGFDDVGSDERPFARKVAEDLKLHNENFLLSDEDGIETDFDEMWRSFDEPFADSSALPTLALCREVRKYVKVAVGGDGGDEVWGGYSWHAALARAERAFALPICLRRLGYIASHPAGERWRYKARVVAASDRLAAWAALRTGLSDEMAKFLPVAAEPLSIRECFAEGADRVGAAAGPLDWAARMDLATYLPDNLMVKADRASMRVGLELREPLLDHQFTAWGLSVPVGMRFDETAARGKLFARRFLAQRIRSASFDRPKQGFTPPLRRWLNGPLAERKLAAIADIEAGRLLPMALPPGHETWAECAKKLGDRHLQFLWRVVCFAGWAGARAAA